MRIILKFLFVKSTERETFERLFLFFIFNLDFSLCYLNINLKDKLQCHINFNRSFFALTLILPACKNKSTKEDTKRREKKKEVDPKIENECKMMMEFNVKNGVEGEYSEFVDDLVRSKGIIDMKMTFEGNILLDTTEHIEMDTIYVGEVNEESLELYSIYDSSSISELCI